ncbi:MULTISPECIES: LysR substrate-binding domain-containing protein [Brucella]|uniref:LysR family transcriptional regulator n=1 Tax=Brucella tritici TaxID=94626 RepID=A0A6L3Y6J2_9HYPH|nr:MULTISPECIES: LysR substrate-binding domain-containing protein [Brucella]KAB2675781.1 LysR family transcriptional regulator [Brucella tritici]MDX4075546.1 LysR substrate-binding domain-containing protein [Brucella sp. NBRC 113783]
MTKFRTRLPPFAALVAFEAAARLKSFTDAADELGVSQPAVTRQIRDFENVIGAPLFERLHRSVELTERGKDLAETLSRTLSEIADSVERLRVNRAPVELKITSYVSFSSLWLVPRITRFGARYPEVGIQAVSQHRGDELKMGSADIALRYGMGNWKDGEVHYLFHDQLFPVCSPDYLQANGGSIQLEDLWQHKIIDCDNHGEWPDWPEFMNHHGIHGNRLKVAHHYTYYTDALMATIAGQGILMGWQSHIYDYLANGQLVRFLPNTMQSPNGHYLVVKNERKDIAIVCSLISWLKEEADRTMKSGSSSWQKL